MEITSIPPENGLGGAATVVRDGDVAEEKE